ncbi:MAG: hypothetical protein U0694_28500, partial [Anaerolineae bacterium]
MNNAIVNRLKKVYFLQVCLVVLLFATNLVQTQRSDFGPIEVRSISWKPDGSQIAIGGGATICGGNTDEYAIPIFDVATSNQILSLNGHFCTVETIAWSPDGTMLASASSDGQSIVWNA